MPIITQLLPVIHIPQACYGELVGHGWEIALQNAGEIVQVHALTSDERQVTVEVAQRIAALSPKNLDPTHHLGEAEAIVLAKRAEFVHDVLLWTSWLRER